MCFISVNPTGSTPTQSTQSSPSTTSQATTSKPTTSQPSTSQPTTSKPSNPNDKCDKEGFMADTSNCKKFYRCVANGDGSYIKYDFDCPEGTAWSQELETCDYEDKATGCARNPDGSTTTSPSSTTTTSSSSTTPQTTQKPTGSST